MVAWFVANLMASFLAFLIRRVGPGAAIITEAIQLGAAISWLAFVGVTTWLYIA